MALLGRASSGKDPVILLKNERISHARNVVANDSGQGFLLGLLLILEWKVRRFFHPVAKQRCDDHFGVTARIAKSK